MKIKCLIQDIFYDGCLKEVDFTLHNLTDKTIKYYTLTFLFFNRVGDLETSKKGFSYEFMGPLSPNQQVSRICDDIDHDINHRIFRSKLIKIKIQYMNSRVETLTRKEIDLEEVRKNLDYETNNVIKILAALLGLGAVIVLGLLFVAF